MNKAFTLIEVLVSVFLIFIIGFALTKISSQNINTIQSINNNNTYLYSTVVNSTHEYRDINDYLSIKDIPLYDNKIEKKKTELGFSSLVIREDFIININLEKESISSDSTKKTFFHIK